MPFLPRLVLALGRPHQVRPPRWWAWCRSWCWCWAYKMLFPKPWFALPLVAAKPGSRLGALWCLMFTTGGRLLPPSPPSSPLTFLSFLVLARSLSLSSRWLCRAGGEDVGLACELGWRHYRRGNPFPSFSFSFSLVVWWGLGREKPPLAPHFPEEERRSRPPFFIPLFLSLFLFVVLLVLLNKPILVLISLVSFNPSLEHSHSAYRFCAIMSWLPN